MRTIHDLQQQSNHGMTLTETRHSEESVVSAPQRVTLFLDGADLDHMEEAVRSGMVAGFTTNPTLVAKAGVENYRDFATEALARVAGAPISLEVLADDLPGIETQAREIASWGPNVSVKVPVCTTSGESTLEVVRSLTRDGLSVNVTAVMTMEQVAGVAEVVDPGTLAYVSIFAGRIADTGRDPCPFMREAVDICRHRPNLKVLWASPREVLNVYQADECGVHVIVLTSDLLAKLSLRNKDLAEYSRETVKMFYDDAIRAGYTL
ncbi:MAG TPA: transaldolase [Longimicrobiales bacterium]|nr:transaldolase [Longimicrobiales bacterium]